MPVCPQRRTRATSQCSHASLGLYSGDTRLAVKVEAPQLYLPWDFNAHIGPDGDGKPPRHLIRFYFLEEATARRFARRF